jgi:3-methyladenine DNA glycosylase/8-oxoguanine DNA glycosylase
MLTYRTDEMPKPSVMLEHAERWRPYRSVASWYLWRAVDLHKNVEIIDQRNPLVS